MNPHEEERSEIEQESFVNNRVSSGLSPLDDLIDGFRLGDNVVWQTESLEDYRHFAHTFLGQSIADRRVFVYIRFGTHAPVLDPMPGMAVASIDPRTGFDVFSAKVNRIITHYGRRAFYVFDNLSCLADLWATDELLANFFQATCPYLYELDTVAYFALTRGNHADAAVARIRDTTQVLLDTFRLRDNLHVRPLKVWKRHSSHMFLPHRIESEGWIPVSQDEVPATTLAHVTRAPWDTVYAELKLLAAQEESQRPPGQMKKRTAELARMLLGNDARIQQLTTQYLDLPQLMRIRQRVVGSGRIGGKAAGMMLARAIARAECQEFPDAFTVMDEDSFHIGSDVFYTFLVRNNLFRERLSITRAGEISYEEFVTLENRFLDGTFDDARLQEFRELLQLIGETPIIVRSSSLLEDGFGNAFAGKYRSEFCVNCGPLEQRLAAFTRAVKLVYVSTLNPDALSYRRNRGMLEKDEQMAILVQRVAGEPHGHYFFPTLAGVAFSRNLYAWTDRIDPHAGMVRLVFGLGTRAVNRVSRDYPRMLAVSHPELRPEIGNEVTAYSQRYVDVLDLDAQTFETVNVQDVLREKRLRNLHYLISVWEHGYLADPVGLRVDQSARVVLTFNRLVRQTSFVEMVKRMLHVIETRYGQPVDMEFAASLTPDGQVRIVILQCRPMWLPGTTDHVEWPTSLPPERVLFRGDRFLNGGVVGPVRYVLYVDPHRYSALEEDEKRKALPRVVGQINRDARIAEGRIMMMGPGRWGSSNPDLGIGVGYADIDRVRVLIEVAYEEDGHMPEVSYGTHFFQDLVEAEILYMPLYPEKEGTDFNAQWLAQAPNHLAELFPRLATYADIVQLIDISAATNGQHQLHLVADPEHRRAVCYLA